MRPGRKVRRGGGGRRGERRGEGRGGRTGDGNHARLSQIHCFEKNLVTDGWTDRLMDSRMDGWTILLMDGQTYKWTGENTHQPIDRLTDMPSYRDTWTH